MKKKMFSLLCWGMLVCSSVSIHAATPQTANAALLSPTVTVAESGLRLSSDYYNKVSAGSVVDGYHILKVSASEIKSNGCYRAIQAALDTARDNATTSYPYKVVVQPGSYELSSSLHIYSNTYLYVQGVTFKQPAGAIANLLKVGATDDTMSGYYYKNIVIDGGIWDQNGNSNTSIKACHAQNVKLINATLKNCKNSHLTEFAGIDGLTIENCTFADQELTVDAVPYTYEAIQFDILLESHLSGYRSEDLPLKNVTVNKCTFKNVPRGVGSHTAILNSPVDTISITNNTFTGLKSLAIQAMNYVNCTISGNKISDCPQGIMVYSVRESGTFLPSTAAKEGGIATSTSSSYVKPSNKQNIKITNNDIHVAGTDPYEQYENAAIFVSGLNLAKAVQGSGDKIPAGNHFISDVTVSGNTIDTDGHGIRLQDVKSSTIQDNDITYHSNSTDVFYGIQLREGTTDSTIKNNTVTKPISGIHVYADCIVKEISSNKVVSPSNNGIMIEDADATDISNNTITKPGLSGIFVYAKGSVGSISKNTVSEPKNYGVMIENATAGKISANKITSPGRNHIFVYKKSTVDSIDSHTLASPKLYCIDIDNATVKNIKNNTLSGCSTFPLNIHNSAIITTIDGNSITGGKSNINIDESTITTISNNEFASATTNAVFLHNKCNIDTISSNTIKSPKKHGFFIEAATVKTIESNKINKPAANGFHIYSGSKVTNLSQNTITSAKKHGITVEKSTVSKIQKNKISSASSNGIHIYNKGNSSSVINNTISSPKNYGISVENGTASKIEKNKITSPGNIGIFLFKNANTKSISKNTITSGKKRGISINAAKSDIKVSENTISKCGDYSIYCNPATTSYTITITENKLTGKTSKDAIRADSGKLVIGANTIKSCNQPIILSSKVKCTLHPNTISGAKSKQVKIDSKFAPNLKATKVKFTSEKAGSVKLKWSKVSSASGYEVYRATSQNGTYKKCATINKGKTVTYTDKTAKAKKTYYYKVVAFSKMNNNKVVVYGSESTPASVKTK